MPVLVRLYLRSVAIGFALSAIFVSALLWLNVGNLWHLILASPQGWIALLMLFVSNAILFAGVQFAIVVIPTEDRGGGRGQTVPHAPNIRALAGAPARPHRTSRRDIASHR